MASTGQALSAHSSGIERGVVRLLQGIFAVGCVFYGVMAFDYFFSFAAGRDGLWLRFFAAVVSEDHVYGEGSVHVAQHAAYSDGFRFMLMHTTMGAFAIAIGPFQFIAAIRRRYPAAHRTMGKIYLGSAVLSMFAGIGYLLMTPFDQVFSGVPFAISLFGLDLAVLYTAWLAYAAIRQRSVLRHQAWMAFNFGLLFATPLLRVLWIVFGHVFPGMDQSADNLGITTFLLPLSLFGALVWITLQRPRQNPAAMAQPGERA